MRLLLLALLATGAAGVELRQGSGAAAAANPIRKVVTMLQSMQKKVTAEGEKAAELHEKYMCYCKTSGSDLSTSIEAAKAKAPELTAAIESSISQKEQLENDLKAHQADRAAAKASMKEASALREKEAAAYSKESAEDKANLDALKKAVTAISSGIGGSFLQTGAASALRALVESRQRLLEADRQDLLAFLAGDQESAPHSGEIVGILKELGDEMAKDLASVEAAEEAAIKAYEELMAAKKKEVAALSKMIETKLQRVGDLGVKIETLKADAGDTAEGLDEDIKFLADLEKNCKTKGAEFAAQKQTRAMEIVALADTIKVLNDDDALDLFKKTLPSASASFMQVQVSSGAMRARALGMVKDMQRRFPSHARLNFIALALHGKKIGFDKIVKMIDEMVVTLEAEQADDDHKKEYCGAQFDVTEDKVKAVTRSIADLETVIEEAKEGIATLSEEIEALEAGVKALDMSVAEATTQRKEENAAYKELMSSDAAAKELILFAKNRMNKFYNPKLYKPPPKAELSSEDRISVNMGGTLAPTAAPGGIAGTGITALVQLSARKDAPPPPPETFKAYTTKTEESNGVIALMDLLVKDLDQEMTIAEATEKEGQADYEKMMVDSAEKRAMDTKALTDKEAAKADLKASLQASKGDKTAAAKELMATQHYMASLHAECDWLLQYFDVRKEARVGEIDALGKAKAVLSGADYSLMQTGSRSRSFLARA